MVVSNVHLKFPLVVYSHKTPEVIWPVPFCFKNLCPLIFSIHYLLYFIIIIIIFFFIIIPILKAKVDAKFGQSSLQIQKRDKTWLSWELQKSWSTHELLSLGNKLAELKWSASSLSKWTRGQTTISRLTSPRAFKSSEIPTYLNPSFSTANKLAQMVTSLPKRTKWRVRLWIQNPFNICVTYPQKNNTVAPLYPLQLLFFHHLFSP